MNVFNNVIHLCRVVLKRKLNVQYSDEYKLLIIKYKRIYYCLYYKKWELVVKLLKEKVYNLQYIKNIIY